MKERPLKVTYLRCTEGNSDKVYHILEYPDRVVGMYGKYSQRSLKEVVYPHASSGTDKAGKLLQDKLGKGYEYYTPQAHHRVTTASAPNPSPPRPKAKPTPKASTEDAPALKGKLEPSDDEHPMAQYLF